MDRNQGTHVWAYSRKRLFCVHCQHVAVQVKAKHRRVVKHTRRGDQGMTLNLKVPKCHCPACQRHSRHSFRELKPRYGAHSPIR